MRRRSLRKNLANSRGVERSCRRGRRDRRISGDPFRAGADPLVPVLSALICGLDSLIGCTPPDNRLTCALLGGQLAAHSCFFARQVPRTRPGGCSAIALELFQAGPPACRTWRYPLFWASRIAAAIGFRVFLPMLITSRRRKAYSGHLHLDDSFGWLPPHPRPLIMLSVWQRSCGRWEKACYVPVVDNLLDVPAGDASAAFVAGTIVSARGLA